MRLVEKEGRTPSKADQPGFSDKNALQCNGILVQIYPVDTWAHCLAVRFLFFCVPSIWSSGGLQRIVLTLELLFSWAKILPPLPQYTSVIPHLPIFLNVPLGMFGKVNEVRSSALTLVLLLWSAEICLRIVMDSNKKPFLYHFVLKVCLYGCIAICHVRDSRSLGLEVVC